ncbi:hypothetical protein [Persicitalea sp.]|uniref:hypothetical protein n=1 Tax=Persicitalea sp. TaxID=3100273 RepID=UPI0035944C2B
MANTNKDIEFLDDLDDYKVASGYSDVRGWEVKDSNNMTIGEVESLVASKSAERVVYLDVEVDDELIKVGNQSYNSAIGDGVKEYINEDGENHLVIPIGMVRLDEENEIVYSDNIDHATFAKANRYKKGVAFDRNYEVDVYRLYTGDETIVIPLDDDNFYDREAFQYSASRKPPR